jgi:hypothetical protein
VAKDNSAYDTACKQIRSILNKVSEGNITPMFTELESALAEGFKPETRQEFLKAYCDIFTSLVASQ